MKVLVTGADGFVGRNLCAALATRDDVSVIPYDVQSPPEVLDEGFGVADVIYHLAGVNRPEHPGDFAAVNARLTEEICEQLVRRRRRPTFVLASSTQALLDNAYGASKRAAEEALQRFCKETGAAGVAHRLKNLFGKWCRPNYNSVTATFCHNIAHGLPIHISDPTAELDLTYIDDVVAAFTEEIRSPTAGGYRVAAPLPSHQTTLGRLAELIESFHDHRTTLRLPDFSEPFTRALYATYLSYLPPEDFSYGLGVKRDARGSLAEFFKASSFGQIFVSRTRPGVTRGNHYHSTKAEKFLVLEGEAAVKLRSVIGDAVVELRVKGEDFRVVDIPPGYTHSIENRGPRELVTLFWASEVFDPSRPDTIARSVLPNEGTAI